MAKCTEESAMASCRETDSVDEKLSPFKLWKSKGKQLLREGKIGEALTAYVEAVKCKPDEKLQGKVEKMREFVRNEQDMSDRNTDMVEIGKGFSLYQGVERELFGYQKEGVLWMWGLYLKNKGGILGDDMGLGKTIQVIAFLSGMFESELVKSVLLLVPVSLIANWKKEFKRWAPGILVLEYHGGTKKEREKSLATVQARGGVLITSYGLTQANSEPFCTRDRRKFVWSYLILDEGHKIKNQTKTTKAVCGIPAKNRLVLTGTAVQNNLQELWALFNFAHQGALVGSLSTFRNQYENPINRAREKDATPGERLLGTEIAAQLRQLIQPYFLRRTKKEVFENKENTEAEKALMRSKLSFTSKKNDLVIWIYLSELQKKVYREFLESPEVANILMTKKSPLVQLTVLKKICDHPRLLSKRACVQIGMYGNMTKEQIERFLEREEGTSMSINDVSDDVLIQESGKMTFVLQLLSILRDEGHRTLIFSQSRKILDIIERILKNRRFRTTRLDGTISRLCERDQIVNNFQTKSKADVFLLTSQVGGVGLTLTAADRVIIYDPSWNPATDAQAVDRAYRIGQLKNVVVYRLITCSTVEEKIYRRQIFKDSIIKQTTGKQKDPMRYFTKQELRELFTLENPNYSGTQVQLAAMHSRGKDTSRALDDHIAILKSKGIFGVSHHDLMFSKESEADPETEFVPGEIEHVKERAKMAQRLILAESDMVLGDNMASETYTVPQNITVRPPGPQVGSQNGDLFPIVVPDDDDSVMLDDVDDVVLIPDDSDDDSSQKSSVVVEDSDVELFPESEAEESIFIDSDEDEDFYDAVKESSCVSVDVKHLVHSPSTLSEKDGAASNTMQETSATPPKFRPKFEVGNTSSPHEAYIGKSPLHSTLQSPPSKRTAPFFVGSPHRQTPSPLPSTPAASPYQAALAESTPVKQEAPAARSGWAQVSVHVVSSSSESEGECTESYSDDDEVGLCQRDQHAIPSSPFQDAHAASSEYHSKGSAAHAGRTSTSVHLVSSSSEGEQDDAESGADDDIVMTGWRDEEALDSGEETP